MNSFNHYALGSVGEWLYSVAGIAPDPEQPGFKRVRLAPQPGGGLTSASARHDSPYGPIASEWRLDGDRFEWAVSVPPNTTASARIPARPEHTVTEAGQPLERADGVSAVRRDANAVVLELGSGNYRFSVR